MPYSAFHFKLFKLFIMFNVLFQLKDMFISFQAKLGDFDRLMLVNNEDKENWKVCDIKQISKNESNVVQCL